MRVKRQFWLHLILILSLIISTTTLMNPVAANPPLVYVDPPSITDKAVGSTFTININVFNVTNLFGFDFKLWYKTSVLTATAVTHPANGFLRPGIFPVKTVINDTAGFVWFAVSQSFSEAGIGVSGSGILATITFTVDALGATCLYIVDTVLTDPNGQLIAHDVSDGHFVNSSVHDIAITSVAPYAPTVILGQTINVTVVARNHGSYTESFTVTAYRNATAIGPSQTVTDLAAGGRTTLTFTWDTTGVTLGKYIISATATAVSGETDTSDNTLNKAYDYANKKDFVYVIITVIDYPEAVFNYSPTKPGVNQTVTFDASDSDPHGGRINYYSWNYGDGVTGGPTVLPVITHQYTSHGIYNVTLTVDDSEGLHDKTWKFVTIYLADVVALSDVTVSSTTVTKPNSVSINVTVVNVCKYNSTFDVTVYYDGTPIDTQTVTNLKAETNTTLTFVWDTTYVRATIDGITYEISANASEVLYDGNTNNNVFIDGDVTVFKGPGPSADFTYSPLQPTTVQPVNFDASLSAPDSNTNSPIISYVWGFGDDTSGSGMTATHTYADAGSYTVRLNVTDSDNLWDAVESTVTVSIAVVIPPSASFTYLPTSPVVGDIVTFDASTSTQGSGTITGYKWDFGDGTTGTGVTTTHIYAASGTYAVTLNVTDTEGSFDTTSQLITVGKKASTITIVASPSKIKLGESTTISGSITPAKASAGVTILYRKTETQTWNTLATVATSSASQYSYAWTPTESGTFELNATWLGDINTLQASNKTTLVVKELVASFTYAPSAPIVGDTVTFTSNSTSTGSIQSWTWDFGDDTSGEGDTVTHTYTTKGDYTVKLTVTDNDGLTDTFTQSITVSERPPSTPLWLIIAAIVAVVIIASGLAAYFLIKKKP